MENKEIIEAKIKQLFDSKELFCKEENHKYKDFASKLRTFDKKIKWVNDFIKPLNLEVKLKSIDTDEPN